MNIWLALKRTVSSASVSRPSATASAAHTASCGVARSVDSSRCSHGEADCSDCAIRWAADAGGDEAEEDDDDVEEEDDEDDVAEDVAEDVEEDEAAPASGGGTASIWLSARARTGTGRVASTSSG